MDNAPEQTGYNTKMQRVARLARMEVQTPEPYSLWENKAESFIKIIEENSNRTGLQRNIPKRVWDFSMVWETEIYYGTAGKDGRPSLENLPGDRVDISELLEF